MDKKEVFKAIKHKQLEDNLKQDFLATLNERILRYQELDFIKGWVAPIFSTTYNETTPAYTRTFGSPSLLLSQFCMIDSTEVSRICT